MSLASMRRDGRAGHGDAGIDDDVLAERTRRGHDRRADVVVEARGVELLVRRGQIAEAEPGMNCASVLFRYSASRLPPCCTANP